MAWKKTSALLLLAGFLGACAPVAGHSLRLSYTGTVPALASHRGGAGLVGVLPFQDARIATGPIVGLTLDEGDHLVQLELEHRVPLADRLTDETVALLARSGLPALRLEAPGAPAVSGASGPTLLLHGIIVEFDLRTEGHGPTGTVVVGEAHVLLRFLEPVSRRPVAGKLLFSKVKRVRHRREVGPADYQEAARNLWQELLQGIGAAVPLDLLDLVPAGGAGQPGV